MSRSRPTLAVLAAGVFLSGCAAGQPTAPAAAAPPAAAPAAAFHGVEPLPVRARPEFVLRDTSGAAYDFGAKTGGQPTLLYFGYTNCPDECPTAMADIATALRTTPAELRDRTRVVFITTDPVRDSAKVLRRFLDQWSTQYVGLRGSQAEVDAAQRAVGIDPARKGAELETLPGRPGEHVHAAGTAAHQHFGPLGYGVAHANVIFGYDTSDRLPVLYPGGVRPSDIAADLPLLASGDSS